MPGQLRNPDTVEITPDQAICLMPDSISFHLIKITNSAKEKEALHKVLTISFSLESQYLFFRKEVHAQ